MRRLSFPLVAAGTGFVGMSLQILWFRGLDIAFQGRPQTLGYFLSAFLAGLAVGSWVAFEHTAEKRKRTAADLRLTLAASLLAVGVIGYLTLPLTGLAVRSIPQGRFFGLAFVFLGAAAQGLALPLLVALGKALSGEEDATLITRVYVANLAGATLGPLVTGFLLLDVWPVAVAAFALASLSLLLACFVYPSARAWLGAAAALAAMTLGHGALYADLYPRLMHGNTVDDAAPAVIVENRSGVIVVSESGVVYGGGAYDGRINTALDTGRNRNGIDRAYMALRFAPHAKRVLEVGASGGSWAQVLVNAPGVESLTSVEINPGYARIIRGHDEVKSLLENPRYSLVFADARTWLATHPEERFDLIVMNTTFHWRSYTTQLLSREMMELFKSRLTPGGVLYLNTTGSEAVYRTVATAFAFTATYANFIAASRQPFPADPDGFSRLLAGWRIDGAPVLGGTFASQQDGVWGHQPIAGDRESLLVRYGTAPLITDDNMAVEFSAR